ncbi:acyl-CoA thioesterase domain-containing protein [Croceicoccus sp. BE223]|uniref:acyl-CoA thioesterase n=1 Tax=Croceicoccus sp. BE223 TaxID=2817716 RepID=UPI0028553AB5|nr:acyl-CoA thioesterase domain-containing protein [Croceicoccus sp. BE223]MDR7102750.1 acyl-CoA thioesterase-2 [Croceicoccus sp. BE223]
MTTRRSLLVGTDAERTAILADLLTVKEVAHDIFVAPRMPDGVGRIFGGQVVAQALAAAQQTVDPGRKAHSLHAYFLRGGNEEYPIELRVERDFDGGSFSNRRVIASQNGTPILNLTASFQRKSAAPHWPVAMPDIPGPDGLVDELDAPSRRHPVDYTGPVPALVQHRAFDLRAPAEQWDMSTAPDQPTFFWLRVRSPLGDNPDLHRLALSYMSDYGLLTTALLRRTMRIVFKEARIASLDHALWFHDEAPVDDWIVFVTDSPWLGHGRALTRGQFFTRDGRLIASAAQEGMIRLPEGSYTPPA